MDRGASDLKETRPAGTAKKQTLILRNITELYALGYFEEITYEVFPGAGRTIDLHFQVKELPSGKLRLGLRYDNYYEFVTAVGIDSKNSPLPGLLLENEIQAGGRRRLHSRISYPSKTLSFPVYPFIHLDYRNVRTRLYGGNGSALLNYKDRSRAFGVGVGLTRWKSFSAEVSYDFEKMDIGPVGVPAQPELTRGLDGRLRKLRIVVTVDTLDSVWLAKKGLFFRTDYEGSYRAFGSDRSYGRAEASVDFYRTFARKHTFRLYGYWGTTSTHVPFYKFLNQGYPLTFVGMKYDQLIGNRMKIIRTDYRYELNNFVHFKVMGNLALGFEQRLPEATLRPNRL